MNKKDKAKFDGSFFDTPYKLFKEIKSDVEVYNKVLEKPITYTITLVIVFSTLNDMINYFRKKNKLKHDDYVWVSITMLADFLCIGRDTITDRINELEKLDLLQSITKPPKRKFRLTSKAVKYLHVDKKKKN